MQRPAQILRHLETSLSAAPESLARVLGVGQRTVAAEVATLNTALAPAAQVRLIGGRYRLRVNDPELFVARREQVLGVQESFNDPSHRSAFILAQLAREPLPVRIETLARQMNVGRTTVTGDLAQLRHRLAPLGVTIEGRPHVGLQLHGDELGIRMAVLRHAYQVAYDDYPLGTALREVLDEACHSHGLDESTAREIARWLTVQLDRMLNGSQLVELPDSHAALRGGSAHRFAQHLADGVGRLVGQPLTEAETLYLALPASGRRTAAVRAGSTDEHGSDPQVQELVSEILARIREELEVDVQPHALLGEFGSHLHFMLNRMRYSLVVDEAADLAELGERFPLAKRMAGVAAQVVLERTGLVMDETEQALAATYLQVFLDDQASRRGRPFRVGILSRRGPAAASLLRSQVSKALVLPLEFVTVASAAELSRGDVDLLVATPGSHLDVPVPVVELSEFFDRSELVAKLSRMRFEDFGPLPMDAPDGSMLAFLLEEDRLVRLPAGCGHDRAVELLAQALRERGLVDEQFTREVARRVEEQEPVLIGEHLAFPHASAPTLGSVTCALGIVEPSGDDGDQLRAVFLMGVPDKANYDDRILIRTYEELIRLGTDARLMDRIQSVSTYPSLLVLLEDMRDNAQATTIRGN